MNGPAGADDDTTGVTSEFVPFALPLPPSTIDRIDEEVALREQETGHEYTREQFVRSAISDLLKRVSGERWREGQD